MRQARWLVCKENRRPLRNFSSPFGSPTPLSDSTELAEVLPPLSLIPETLADKTARQALAPPVPRLAPIQEKRQAPPEMLRDDMRQKRHNNEKDADQGRRHA